MKKTKLLGALLFSVVATTTAAFAAACFPKTANYKVEFIGGAGASGTMVTQVVEDGSSFVVPENAFTNGDKIFLYYLNGETVVNEGDEITVTSNVSLTAVWGNTVTFEGSGATGEMNTTTVVSGTEYTVPENAFTNGDKTFMYFSDGANQVAVGDKITVSTNVTLTAVWGYNFAYEGISETLLQVGTVHTVAEFAGNVPFGKLFAGYTDGTTQYSVGDTITVNADITLSPVFNVDTSLIEGTKYSYPGSTTAYVQFNEDGTIYRAFHVKNDSFGVDYDNVTSASVYELTKEFDGTSLEYKFQYSTSQPLQTVKLTFSENGVVTALVTLSENNQSQSFVLYCGEKKEYTTEVGTLTAFVTETTANYGWTATDGEYTAVTLTDEIEVGNIVKVMNGDVEIIEIQFTETGVRTVGAEKGTVIDGYTLDGWGNATKNGETVAYRISPKTSYVVIGNKGYALENEVYVEKQADGVQNVFVKVDGSYVYSLDFDGFGTVYAVQKTYSTYEYVGVYSVSGDTITVTDCNYSFDKTYSVIENGNVLSVSSYSGVEYYVIDGYVSNEQLDDEASGDTWKTENGLLMLMNLFSLLLMKI